jgi:hypothetical protein
MSWLSEYIENNLKYQIADHSSVKISLRYSERFGKFYIDSKAGLLIYRPKDLNDTTRFRNKWINKFELLKEKETTGEDIDKDIFSTYLQILKEEKVSYEANINTRIKKSLWNIKKLI